MAHEPAVLAVTRPLLNGALAPVAVGARLVQTAISGHALDAAVERRPFADGERQIQAFYIMDLPTMDAALEWAITWRAGSPAASPVPRSPWRS